MHTSLKAAFACMVVMACACNGAGRSITEDSSADEGEGCYQLDPELGLDSWCEYPAGEVPNQWNDVDGNPVRYCEPRPAGGCRTCPADELDAAVLAVADRVCDGPVQHFLRGCYQEYPPRGDQDAECCYTGFIYPCKITLE